MRKTVTVSVQIQMDVEIRKDTLPQVQDVLELINKVVDNYGIDASPQIFISDISELQKLKNLKNWCKRHIKKQKGYYGDAGAFDDLTYLDAWKVIDKINELMKED